MRRLSRPKPIEPRPSRLSNGNGEAVCGRLLPAACCPAAALLSPACAPVLLAFWSLVTFWLVAVVWSLVVVLVCDCVLVLGGTAAVLPVCALVAFWLDVSGLVLVVLLVLDGLLAAAFGLAFMSGCVELAGGFAVCEVLDVADWLAVWSLVVAGGLVAVGAGATWGFVPWLSWVVDGVGCVLVLALEVWL